MLIGGYGRMVSHLRNIYPQVPVIVRARDLEASAHLLHAGATKAFPEAIEASLRWVRRRSRWLEPRPTASIC